jgi:hypothetical protein
MTNTKLDLKKIGLSELNEMEIMGIDGGDAGANMPRTLNYNGSMAEGLVEAGDAIWSFFEGIGDALCS